MTNFEKYKDELLSISSRGLVAVDKKTRKPTRCKDFNCTNCHIKGNGCVSNLIKWLYEEAQHD